MKRVWVFVTVCVMCVGLGAEITAQAPAQTPAPPAAPAQPAPPAQPEPPLPGEGPLAGEPVILDLTKPKSATPIVLDVIEVVGCVSQAPDKKWIVTNASNPLKSGASAQTVGALKAAGTKALGTGRYVLIGASEWNPPSHNGEKVAVRGFVIKDKSENRLNVTSLNKVGDPPCK